jgi:predicted component of type VI protein secretion system
MRILELFCDVDDFCQLYRARWEQRLLTNDTTQRSRTTQMAPSEMMTILIPCTAVSSTSSSISSPAWWPIALHQPNRLSLYPLKSELTLITASSDVDDVV